MAVSDDSDRDAVQQWVDRPVVVEGVFFCIGAALLCILAIFQKSAMNEDVTAIQGYVLPFFFGGISAALVGFINRRSRRHLTARILAQAERDILLSASEAKSACLAAMSHELRTPLNAILGFSGSIQNETFGPVANAKYSEYIEDISQSGQHLLALINDLLDISAIEAGKLALHEENINLAKTVENTLHVLQALADTDDVQLIFSDPGTDVLPPLYADERRFRQIVLNLASNAIKFTPPGGTVTLGVGLSPHGQHVLTVSDTGIGMDDKELQQAMSSFGQVNSHLARQHEGTGLGLPLTKGLVDLHDGEFAITSAKGSGTTVVVSFPSERTASGPSFSI